MKHLVFSILLTATPAQAAYLHTWDGPGPNACDGRCSFEWARTQLSPSETQQLEALLAEQPDPGPVVVNRGDAFALMSYYKDGAPVAYRSALVSGIDTVAQGWVVGDWAFVQLHECSNWAVVRRDQNVPLPGAPVPTYYTSSPPVFFPPLYPPVFWEPPTYIPPTWEPPTDVCCGPTLPPEPPEMPAVPLPASILLLVGALASLLLWRRA
ncbi:MAG TPA: hypothetical protein VIG24_12985 [Acidimicrobiia bacterium]